MIPAPGLRICLGASLGKKVSQGHLLNMPTGLKAFLLKMYFSWALGETEAGLLGRRAAGGESFPRILHQSGDLGATQARGDQAEMGWGEVCSKEPPILQGLPAQSLSLRGALRTGSVECTGNSSAGGIWVQGLPPPQSPNLILTWRTPPLSPEGGKQT